MNRYKITNLITGYNYEITDDALHEKEITIDQWLIKKQNAYGKVEHVIDITNHFMGSTVEDISGTLFVVSPDISGNNSLTVLQELRPEWFLVDTPILSGSNLIVSAQHQIVIEDMLEEFKQKKIKAIDNRTQELIANGFLFDGHTFSLSLNAQSNFMGIKVATDGGLLTEANYPYEITTLDDETYLLQWSDKETFFGLVLGSVSTHLASGRALKSQVKQAVTQEQLDAVTDNR